MEEQLRQENERLRQENQHLHERLAELEAMVKKLTEQLGQNSRNSNWPSSRDKTRPKRPKPNRSQRKTGGQKGHQGHTLEMVDKPNEVVVHQPRQCHYCQTDFGADAEVIQVKKRQVLDLPPLRFVTTEHQVHSLACQQCGQATKASFPKDVTQPVQYGTRVKQLAVYLRTEQFVPYQRSQHLLNDLFELPVCVGSLQNFVKRAAKQVKPAMDAVKKAIEQANVVHADETGFYIGGKRHWLHTASTPTLSYFAPHQKRGREAVNEIGILPHVTGTLVHDAWQTYFAYETDHALCHAHNLRDLTAIIENDQHLWAKQMHTFLLTCKRLVAQVKQGGEATVSPAILRRVGQLYDTIVANGLTETPPPDPKPPDKRGRPKRTKARCLVERFATRKEEMLRFVRQFEIPFDNNLAERDIRMMKVQQKVSGCFRSQAGAEGFCQLRSYTSTMRKQGLNVWDALGSLFTDDVLFPQTTPV